MERIKELPTPFTLYDFFGYLTPGFFLLILFIIEYDVGDIMEFYTTNPVQPNSLLGFTDNYPKTLKFEYLKNFVAARDGSFSFFPFLVLVILLYLAGHVIASLSSMIFEKVIVQRLAGYPSRNLVQSDNKTSKLARIVFGDFVTPLDKEFITEFDLLINGRFGFQINKANYFWLCFTDIARQSPVGYKRTVHFLNLYGFARNVSMCFLLYVIFRVGVLDSVLGSKINSFNWFILGGYLVIAIIMFWNYLKLFNRQCKELYFHFYTMYAPRAIKGRTATSP